jgi:CheY-like chemotaxis protein
MRILVIDDARTVGSAIKLRLEARGVQVHYAESALAGIAAFQNQDFDLAIIDIIMPVIGGIEAIKLIRQIKPDLPIIAMSGYLDRDNQSSARRFPHFAAGSVYSLAKPFRPRDLVTAVEACLGRRLPGAVAPRRGQDAAGG